MTKAANTKAPKANGRDVPKGFRKLRIGEKIKAGDKYPIVESGALFDGPFIWRDVCTYAGQAYKPSVQLFYGFIIRKVKKGSKP